MSVKGAAKGAAVGAVLGSIVPGAGTVVGAGIGAWIGGSMDSQQKKKSNGVPPPPPLALRVQTDTVATDDAPITLWLFEIKGAMYVPHADYPIKYRVTMLDVTDDTGALPVLTFITELQGEHGEFSAESAVHRIPYEQAMLSDWLRVGAVPPAALMFPRRGMRELSVHVRVVSDQDGTILHTAQRALKHNVTEDGYVDAHDKRKRCHAVIIRMAVALSAVNGAVDKQSHAHVQKWIVNRAKGLDSNHQDFLQGELESATRELKSSRGIALRPLCATMLEVGTMAERYEALDLCLRVAAADNAASANEFRVLQAFAQWLEVDYERFRTQLNKTLRKGIHEDGAVTPEYLFGIDASMPAEEQRAKLNSEFKKYNGLASHNNPDIRADAEAKLRQLVDLRKKLAI